MILCVKQSAYTKSSVALYITRITAIVSERLKTPTSHTNSYIIVFIIDSWFYKMQRLIHRTGLLQCIILVNYIFINFIIIRQADLETSFCFHQHNYNNMTEILIPIFQDSNFFHRKDNESVLFGNSPCFPVINFSCSLLL